MADSRVGFAFLGVLVVMAFGARLTLSEDPERGPAAATWVVDATTVPSTDSGRLTVLVQRVGCSGGITGRVLAPRVRTAKDEVVITFEVESLPPGDYTCPSNEQVRYEVRLSEPLGRRRLVDGLCRGEPWALGTAFCDNSGVRWPGSP